MQTDKQFFQKRSIDELLESRHTSWVEWVELWPAYGPGGAIIDEHVTIRATVHDCINIQRAAVRQAGKPATKVTDARMLEDFMAIHMATILVDHKSP